jgi:hypothetical protein
MKYGRISSGCTVSLGGNLVWDMPGFETRLMRASQPGLFTRRAGLQGMLALAPPSTTLCLLT